MSSSVMSRIAAWAVRHRSRMPQWAQRAMYSVASNPDGLIGRVASRLLGGDDAPVTEVPDRPVRVYIAPTNYAGQGYLWARALEARDSAIAARNMAVVVPGTYSFPANTPVPITVFNGSATWAEAEWAAASRFTHVLVEAQRSMFGKQFERDVAREVAALEAAGVSVAFLSHGDDVRDPESHIALTPWSPYTDDPRAAELGAFAQSSREMLERLRRPTFVSTPDLLSELPWAIWCPVVVDWQRFATETPAFRGQRFRVIHASSNPIAKGSDHIAPALAPLLQADALSYELISRTPPSEMPRVFAEADIVLDQFRLGSYGVAACEAMAAGRVVVGHVLPFVRERVEQDFGISLPILEATPDTLADVVAGLIADPERARSLAAAGPEFVRTVHGGEPSARALIDGWISPSPR